MKKTLTLLTAVLFSLNLSAQLSLVQDADFNGGSKHRDLIVNSTDVNSVVNPLRFKQLNDSTYAYFGDMRNQISDEFNMVFIKTIKADGSVDDSKTILVDDYLGGNPYETTITDVICGPSGEIYVLQNDNNGNGYIVKVKKFIYSSVNMAYEPDASYGSGGVYSTPNTYQYAKGYLNSANNIVFYSTQQFNDIARHVVAADGSGSTATMIWNNGADTSSSIVDILVLSDSSVIIADETLVRDGLPPNILFQKIVRLIKLNNQGNIDTNFGIDGVRYMDSWEYFGQVFPNTGSIYINKLYQDSSSLLVVGSTGDPFSPNSRKGVVSKMDMNGQTLFNDFSPFANSFGYSRYILYDVRKTSDNNYLLFGFGQDTVITINNALILAIDANNGTFQTSYGDNGKVYESLSLDAIYDARIIANGPSVTDDEIIVMGLTDSNLPANSGGFKKTTAINRLVWSTGTSVAALVADKFMVFPNPSQSAVNVKLTQPSKVRLLNLLGTTVNVYQMNEGINTIDVNNLIPGTYILQNEKGESVKFIKN